MIQPRAASTGALVLALAGLASCTLPSSGGNPATTLEAARAAVVHHWDINRRALRATSGPEARRLIQSVEAGDALRMDEPTITADAQARGSGGLTPPGPIADATNIHVYVPRQSSYPAMFLSLRDDPVTDRGGRATGKIARVLELFRRQSASDGWRNTAYAVVGDGLDAKLDIAIDRDGYASLATAQVSQLALSTQYAAYLNAAADGKATPSGSRLAAGPLTDQFAGDLKKALSRVPSIKATATFSPLGDLPAISLRTRAGGVLAMFNSRYDVKSSPNGGGCIDTGSGSGPGAPGSFASINDHLLQDLAAVVPPETGGAITVVAESEGLTGTDTSPCTGGTTV